MLVGGIIRKCPVFLQERVIKLLSIQIRNHDNIVAFLGIVDAGGEFCVIMELAQRDLLSELQMHSKNNYFSQRYAMSVCKQIASALVI
jgi:hypothetical protein